MGLLTSYGSNNKVMNSSKQVVYNQRKLYGQYLVHTVGAGQDIYYTCWEYERICSLSFEYVGMDLDTATSCAEDLTEAFTRNTKVSAWEASGASAEFGDLDGGQILMSDVSIQKMSGHMYKVVVQVHERDTRLRRVPVTSVASLFSTENERDYDD